jgi:hypothetical protein
MVKDSVTHCNEVFFPPGYFGYVGYHQFYLGVLGVHVVALGFVWFVSCHTNIQQNSHPSKNIQSSHNEQIKQNHDQVQYSDMARTMIMLFTGW